MAIPAQVQILDKVEERLRLCTVANGYSTQFNKIVRSRITNLAGKDVPIIFYWADNDTVLEKLGGKEKRQLNIGFGAFLLTRDESFSDVAYITAADIKTSLNRDTSAPKVSDPLSRNLGGLVSKLSIDDMIPVIGEGQTPFCGLVTSIQVEYFIGAYDSFTILN